MQTKNNGRFKKGFTPWNKGTGEMSKPKTCLHCQKTFYSRFKKHKFCSHHCSTQHPISEETRQKLSKYHKANPVRFWLNRYNPFISGNNNIHWNGGKTKRYGYILILSKDHPYRNNENYVWEHRLVAEKILGRYLTSVERVHHINGVVNDNRPENLYLFSHYSEHSKYHGYKNPPILTSNLIVKELTNH